MNTIKSLEQAKEEISAVVEKFLQGYAADLGTRHVTFMVNNAGPMGDNQIAHVAIHADLFAEAGYVVVNFQTVERVNPSVPGGILTVTYLYLRREPRLIASPFSGRA